jgi:hypothetical protein
VTGRTELGAVVALFALVLAVVCVCFWPGHMGIDTISQIVETDTGDFTNRHAPLLEALWRPFFELGAGPGAVLVGQVIVFLAGAYLVLRAAFRPIYAAAITVVISLAPPVFPYLGFVARDTWFAALLVLSFGLLVRAAQSGWPARGRWVAAAIAAIWLTLASRQNAAPAIAVACVFACGLLLERWVKGREPAPSFAGTRLRLLVTTVLAGVALTAGLIGTQALAAAAIGVRDVNPEQYLFIYDLAALSEREEENLFPPDVLPGADSEAIDTGWDVDSMVFLVFGDPPPIPSPLPTEQMSSLRDAWVDEVTADPGGYLAVRGELFARQLALTREPRWVFTAGISENPFGYEIEFPWANQIALDYLSVFTHGETGGLIFFPNGGMLYAVWAYLLIAAAAAAVLLRRGRSGALVAAGALGLSAITLQAGLFFGAMGTEYRFEFPAVVAALVAGAVAAGYLLERRRKTPAVD